MPSLSRAQERAHLEVLHDRHAREDASTFGNLDDAPSGHQVRGFALNLLALVVMVPSLGVS